MIELYGLDKYTWKDIDMEFPGNKESSSILNGTYTINIINEPESAEDRFGKITKKPVKLQLERIHRKKVNRQ